MHRISVVSLRLVRERSVPYRTRRLGNSQGAFELFRELIGDFDREAFWLACLNTKNDINCLSQISLGSLDSTVVHPREVFKVAVLANAAGVITVHNHPSGDPSPSSEDRRATTNLRQAAGLMGIKFLDHLIIGDGKFYSFADSGDL